MFDVMKKAKALENLGKRAGEVIHVFTTVDLDKDGIADFKENMDDLMALPALIKKEGSEVVEEAEDARKKINEVLLRIGGRVGESIEHIQEVCGKQITEIEKIANDLQK